MKRLLKNHADKLRFGLVGATNTLIDFSILFLLFSYGLSPLLSNLISTSCALSFSFFANKKYTFRDHNPNQTRQIFIFLVITLIGLWIIQPVIIWSIQLLLGNNYLSLLVAKLTATIASLVWNYLMYRKYVFKG